MSRLIAPASHNSKTFSDKRSTGSAATKPRDILALRGTLKTRS
jgi:hypothetical protein